METDKPGAKGCVGDAIPPEPVLVGKKCATSHGKIVKFPWVVYAKYVALHG